MTFFHQKQAAAVLKHGILRRHLPVMATKTGSRAGKVVYLDGYAGPGVYNDGTEGSPALAIQTAEKVASYRGNAVLHGYLCDRKKESTKTLARLLAERGLDWDVRCGSIEEVLPEILDELDPQTPLFAFLDPFGLPIPLDMLHAVLRRGGMMRGGARTGAATEVLLNFSIPGVNRICGQLTGQFTAPWRIQAAKTMVARMNEVFGGDWWQPIWTSGAADRIDQILAGYIRRIRDGLPGAWGIYNVAVADRWKGPASYHLLFITQHPDGVWAFNEAVSGAMEEYRQFCHTHEGMFDLEPLPVREAQWVTEIATNLERLLATEEVIKPVFHMLDLFGSAFGQAREKHLRAALNQLYADGKITTNPKGKRLGTVAIRSAVAE